jgi:hypothetical protein
MFCFKKIAVFKSQVSSAFLKTHEFKGRTTILLNANCFFKTHTFIKIWITSERKLVNSNMDLEIESGCSSFAFLKCLGSYASNSLLVS